MSVKVLCTSCIKDSWREIVYILILILLASILLPYLYQNLAYSAFYNPSSISQNKLLNDNLRRGQQAASFLKINQFPGIFSRANSTGVRYCFAIVSVKRHQEMLYLTQTIARLLLLLRAQKELTYSVMVYNPDGDKHTEAMQLAQKIPVFTTVPQNISKGRRGRTWADPYEKERYDYVSVLQLCHQRNATYSIILQDDAVLDWNFFPKLEFVLAHWLPMPPSSWAILKLFYPEKYQDWGNDASMIVELVVVVLVAGSLQTLLVSIVVPGVFWRRTTALAPVLRLTASITFVLVVILTLGRPHWEELRKLHPILTSVVPARGCCIPAMLYPRTHLAEVVEYLSSVVCTRAFPVDLALDLFVEKKKLDKYLVVPNIARHIGYLSSLPKGFKNSNEFGLLFLEP